jgi:hypothetical protein
MGLTTKTINFEESPEVAPRLIFIVACKPITQVSLWSEPDYRRMAVL